MDWHVEGNGSVTFQNGALVIETFRVRPDAKATTVWRRDLTLPKNFELSFTHRSDAENGNTMVIFNALPLSLAGLFDDPRPDARYNDLTAYGKMMAHTVGFHRGVYGRPSVLRKVGGHVPDGWGSHPFGTPAWNREDSTTALRTAQEPLTGEDRGKPHRYVLTRMGDRITFAVNQITVHDYTDCLEYPYIDKMLHGGHLAFRNFTGPAVDVYDDIMIRAL